MSTITEARLYFECFRPELTMFAHNCSEKRKTSPNKSLYLSRFLAAVVLLAGIFVFQGCVTKALWKAPSTVPTTTVHPCRVLTVSKMQVIKKKHLGVEVTKMVFPLAVANNTAIGGDSFPQAWLVMEAANHNGSYLRMEVIPRLMKQIDACQGDSILELHVKKDLRVRSTLREHPVHLRLKSEFEGEGSPDQNESFVLDGNVVIANGMQAVDVHTIRILHFQRPLTVHVKVTETTNRFNAGVVFGKILLTPMTALYDILSNGKWSEGVPGLLYGLLKIYG